MQLFNKKYQKNSEFIAINDAIFVASQIANKAVTRHNLMYLVQYGKVGAIKQNGETFLNQNELKVYYHGHASSQQMQWEQKYGDEINWHLSFSNLKESDTTKHVHRLHPYKGKFIPQLVEYFLNDETDQFKTKNFFKKDDIILDPFCGSGTTLVQANELGMHGIGIDISSFNCMIGRVKMANVDLLELQAELAKIQKAIDGCFDKNIVDYTSKLDCLLSLHNQLLTAPIIKVKSIESGLTKQDYISKIWQGFCVEYERLKDEFDSEILTINSSSKQPASFIESWYFKNVRSEMNHAFEVIRKIQNSEIKQIAAIILSRTIRSCRATTHSDLATLIAPQTAPYYCQKHNKICRPIMTIKDMFRRYSSDSVARFEEFKLLRSNHFFSFLNGDSRIVDIALELEKKNPQFAKKVKQKKIAGIFSSPPYVGQIDYHEQHAYAYEIFGFERNDEKEIGPLFKGQGREAKESYSEGISQVLKNCKKFLRDDYDIFLVANDKHNLYQAIAQKAGMKIVNSFKRPVLNRSEKTRNLYAEEIFHLKAI